MAPHTLDQRLCRRGIRLKSSASHGPDAGRAPCTVMPRAEPPAKVVDTVQPGVKVTILDGKRLEATACQCSGSVVAEYDRVLGNNPERSQPHVR